MEGNWAPARVRRNFRIDTFSAICGGVYIAVLITFMPIVVRRLGGSTTDVAIVIAAPFVGHLLSPISAYLLSGLLAGIAGVLFVAQYRQGKPDAGAGLELDAIAAVVIGGTSLMGGRGSLAGTFVGVLIFGLLSDILQLQNIDSNVQLVMKGLIIVCTVLVQEQNLGQLVARWRFARRTKTSAEAETAEPTRPPSAAKAQFAREHLDEAS